MLANFLLAMLLYCNIEICLSQITSDGCGTTKTCFQNPSGCQPSETTCHFYSWKKSDVNGFYEFEMSGGTNVTDQYVALALGTVSQMKDADLYYCNGTDIRSAVIQQLHLPPTYLEMTDGLATKSASIINGIIQCVLTRPASVTKTISGAVDKDFDITKEEYYLLGAIGPMNGDAIQKHNIWKTVTTTTYNFATELKVPVTDEGCASTKTCFKDPANCNLVTAECRFYSWKKSDTGDTYQFEMSGGTGGGLQYIALALGTIPKMQDADLYYCDGTAVRSGVLQERHNPPAYLEMTGGLVSDKASTTNGVAQCVFTRPASVTKTISNGVSKDFDITKEEYYLLGAIGPMNETEIRKHDTWKTVTAQTYQFGTASSSPITDTDCDSDAAKTCFKDPKDCTAGNSGCHYYSWKKLSDGTWDIEMSGGTTTGQYVAFALGTTNAMQDADLYYCDGMQIRSGAIQQLHKPPAYLEMNNGLTTKFATTINGVTQCVLNRPASVTKEISNGVQKNFNLAAENYYLLAAVGKMNGAQIQKHTWRAISDSKIVPSSGKPLSAIQPTILGLIALLVMKSSTVFVDN